MNRKEISFWEQSAFLKPADFLVIGSGIVGLSAAIDLKTQRPGNRIVVVDRDAFGFGGTTRNAGFACFGSPSEVLSDLQSMTENEVLELLTMRWEGLRLLRKNIGDNELGYSPCGSIELFTAEDQEVYANCMEQLPYLNELLKPITGTPPFRATANLDTFNFQGFKAGIDNTQEGSIDTGKMAYSLRAKALRIGVEIFNGIEVKSINSHGTNCTVELQYGELKANQVLVCTNGFTKQLLPKTDVQPARNKVLLTSEIPTLNWDKTFHFNEGYFYFRNVGKRILIGGGRHLDETWETSTAAVPPNVTEALQNLLSDKILPNTHYDIDFEWTGYLGIGRQRKIELSSPLPNVHLAVRMGGMGVAIGSYVGQQVAQSALDHF